MLVFVLPSSTFGDLASDDFDRRLCLLWQWQEDTSEEFWRRWYSLNDLRSTTCKAEVGEMEMESPNDSGISVFSEVKDHTDKKFQSLLNSKEMLEYCIQQERYHHESLTWEIKHFEGVNAVARDKNFLEYEDLDQLFHENEGLKEQIASAESQLDLADLSVTMTGIDLGEDTRISCQETSSHQMENKDSEREDKLKALQQMSINLRNEISRLDQEVLALESKISIIGQSDFDGVDVILEHAGRLW